MKRTTKSVIPNPAVTDGQHSQPPHSHAGRSRPQSHSTRQDRWLRPGLFLFYAVFVLEILFMISPFALYFYSVYGPVLNLFHGSAATSWLTSFFLPHFSTTGLALVDNLSSVGLLLAFGGLGLFLIGFIQIYANKLTGRGAVSGGLYRFIRHPQYTALIVAGVGTLLIWPRFMVLVSFVTMVFLYSWLARHEETVCREKYGHSYREVERRTGRFLPRAIEGLFARLGLGSWFEGKRAVVAWALSLGSAIAVAFALQNWSVDQVSAIFDERIAVVSPAAMPDERIREIVDLARDNPTVAASLRGQEPLLAYVLPESWYLADIPAEPLPPGSRGHDTPITENETRFKVLFTRARSHRQNSQGREILLHSYGREPLTLAIIDLAAREVVEIKEPMAHVLWGDIPTPLF